MTITRDYDVPINMGLKKLKSEMVVRTASLAIWRTDDQQFDILANDIVETIGRDNAILFLDALRQSIAIND